MQDDGKLVLAGDYEVSAPNNSHSAIVVMRLTAAGQPDAAFGSNGVGPFLPGGGYYGDSANDLVVQPDGKTVRLWAQDHEGWLTMDATATLR